MSKYNRITSHDKHFGPFTLGERSDSWRPIGIELQSGDDEHAGCSLLARAFGYTLRLALPEIIKPYRAWVSTERYEWSRPGGGYWDVHRREYGFYINDGYLGVHFGAQTHDSVTTQDWGYFLPWTQLRHVRKSWYGPTGQHIETLHDSDSWEVKRAQRDWEYEFEKGLAKVKFYFQDYDGEVIVAATQIIEREWRKGDKWCKWLSWFSRPLVRRSLELDFSKEVGREKGSWKGGTTGHSIEMLPGELHEEAFKRYCEKENLKFLMPV